MFCIREGVETLCDVSFWRLVELRLIPATLLSSIVDVITDTGFAPRVSYCIHKKPNFTFFLFVIMKTSQF